jgi:hypothetical protein
MERKRLTGGGASRGPTRRDLLRAVSVALVALSGCGRVTRYEFSATPVGLRRDVRAALGYELIRHGSVVAERSRTVGGVDVTTTVESHLTAYRAPDGDERARATPPILGAISTPEAVVMGRPFNPLASLSIPNLLTSKAGARFLRGAGVDRVGHDRSRVRWERGPTFLDSRAMALLGTETTLESYAGVLGGSPPSVVFVHLARVTDDSVVIVVAMHGHDVADPNRPFVGTDGAHATPARIDRLATTVQETLTFRYGTPGAGDN